MSNGALRAGDLDFGVTCPTCAGPKTEQAQRCQSCWGEHLMAPDHWEQRTCHCGGPKSRGRKQCLACDHAYRRAHPELWDFSSGRSNPPDHPWRRSIAA